MNMTQPTDQRHYRLVTWMVVCLLLGCEKGGAGGGGPASEALPPRPDYSPVKPTASPSVQGKELYKVMGCRICHGDAGKGGVDNPNSITGEKINGLTLVKEGYTLKQLQQTISKGVPIVKRKDNKGPVPPFRMPVHGRFLASSDIEALAWYLFSLYPKDRVLEDDWDD